LSKGKSRNLAPARAESLIDTFGHLIKPFEWKMQSSQHELIRTYSASAAFIMG